MLKTWIRRLLALVRPNRFRAEMDEELQFHFDMARDRFADEGMTPDDARLAAARRLRSPLVLREQAREAWGWGGAERLLQDLRYAVRLLVRRPGFAVTAITVLGLGLGASTTVFSVVYGVLMRPLPFERPDGLVYVREGIPRTGMRATSVSPPDFLGFQERQRSFEAMAAYANRSYELSGDGEPERLTGARVGSSIFGILGRQPMLGRAFTDDEDRNAAPVAILSWRLWHRRFLGDPGVLGRTIQLERRPYTVIGVMPPAFEFPLRGPAINNRPAEILVPLGFTVEQRTNYGSNFVFSVIARLKSGVTVEAASAEAASIVPALEARYPAEAGRDTRVELEFLITPLHQEIVGAVAPMLWVLFGAVTLVLLVGCADLGGLLLTRAATRAGELNVRAALGAGRGRLIRQLMTESLVIAAAGGLLGLGLAYAATRLIATQAGAYLPRAEEIGLGRPVVCGMIAFSLLSALAFGLAPALWITGAHGAALANRRTTGGRGERRLLRTLVVVQVTLAIVLAVGAGLLVRSLTRLMAVDPGFRGAQVVAAVVRLPQARYRETRVVRGAAERLLASARALPGVQAAALASTLPMHVDETRPFGVEGATGRTPPTAVTWVMGSYFAALDVPLRRGRLFTDSDGLGGERVAIVNETLARRVWGQADPIGRRICWFGPCGDPQVPPMTVIGVVGDIKQGPLSSETRAEVFEPFLQVSDVPSEPSDAWRGARQLSVLVRGESNARSGASAESNSGGDSAASAADAGINPDALIGGLRQAVRDIDPSLPLTDTQRLDAMVRESVTPQRFSAQLLGAFALTAVLLAALGLYGLLSSFVTQRTREIGVRVALGAAPGDVVGLIVRQGLTLVTIGLAIGLAGALGATQAMKGLLFGVEPFDPMTFGAVAAVLASVGAAASLLPAWRAARVDPVRALRGE
jgi:putative ABC transport system permease protein